MTPLALILILLGSAVQFLGILFFAALPESIQTLPLVAAISVGSAIEVVGVLILIRYRR